jgi:phospholipid transport system substrate-binding protein
MLGCRVPFFVSSGQIMARSLRLLMVVALCVAASAAARADPQPTAVIDRLHAALLDTMQRASVLGVEGRYRSLDPVLREVYDFEQMIMLAAGAAWAGADDGERQALAAAFTHFSVATYASRFDGYSGERFEIAGERGGPRNAVIVDTRLVRTDSDPVPISYVLRARDGSWRIVDVLLEKAISELAVRRSEYAKVLAQGGIRQLTKVLNDRADALLVTRP